MDPRNFFAELKRRNVYKVAVAYAIVGWLLIQVTTQVFPFFEIPNWAVRLVVLLIMIGFPIALVIAWAFELTPEGIKRTERADAAQQQSRNRVWIYVVIIAGAMSAGLFFLGRYTAQNKQSRTGDFPTKSIAVLPFENLSRDPENAYFAAGIQDEIITRLSKVAELKVISSTSTQRFKSSPEDLPAIAKQLGVANILEGSVQRSTDQVRVNVQLIKAATDEHLWADTFDRKLTDVFTIESQIAKTIADTLKAKLTGSERNAIAVQPTQNTEAHQLYLKGRYLWNRRTGDNIKKALAYFQQAAEKDPNYALAYAGMADAYALSPPYATGMPQDCFPRARAAAQKAIELDETLAEGHASLGIVCFSYYEFAQSAKEFERAIELNPNYASAHHWYGRCTLLMAGQIERGTTEVRRALELDPVSPIFNTDLGLTYMEARRYDDAIDQLHKTIEMDPQFYYAHRVLGWALELKGSTHEAIAEYHRALELYDDPVVLGLLGHAEATIGKQGEARKILIRLSEEARTRYVSSYAFAVIYLALGEREHALDWLEKAVREHAAPNINLIKIDPYLDPLRGDPRFEALVSRILSGSVK